MVPESRLESTENGLVPTGNGWFVLSARDSRWYHAEGRTAVCDFEGDQDFAQLGINLSVIAPGEALLIIEGEERALRQWDFVHCPPETKHTIVGTGDTPCVVLAVGARDRSTGPDWGGYTVDEVALRQSAGVEQETTEPKEAYAPLTKREAAAYREGWLPE